jgi:hypothetical protein
MSTTDQHLAVMLFLHVVKTFTQPAYTMAGIYSIYFQNKLPIDTIYSDPAQLDPILVQYGPEVPNIIIIDKQEDWNP